MFKPTILLAAALMLVTPALAKRHRQPVHRVKSIQTLFPTAGSLLAQNAAADRMGLPRVKSKAALREWEQSGVVVPLPLGSALKSSVPQDRAFLKAFAAERLDFIAQDFYGVWGAPLHVDSAVRPLDLQKRLWRSRRVPAAPPYGPTASVHPTGAAFDIGKRKLTRSQLRWLEWRLWYLQQAGWVIVEEERGCFHVVALRDRDGSPGIGQAAAVSPLFGESAATFDPPAILHRAHGADIAPDITAP